MLARDAVVTDLKSLSVATPRPDALVAELKGRMNRTAGFIAYGILYLVFVVPMCGAALAVPLTLAFIQKLGKPVPTWAGIIVISAGGLGVVLAIWAFVRWVGGRLRGARVVLRDGTLAAAHVRKASTMAYRGQDMSRATVDFELAGKRYSAKTSYDGQHGSLERGQTTWVLAHPTQRLVLIFVDETAVSGTRSA